MFFVQNEINEIRLLWKSYWKKKNIHLKCRLFQIHFCHKSSIASIIITLHGYTPQVLTLLKHECQRTHIQEKIISEWSLLTLPLILHHLLPSFPCIWFQMEHLIFVKVYVIWCGHCTSVNMFTWKRHLLYPGVLLLLFVKLRPLLLP